MKPNIETVIRLIRANYTNNEIADSLGTSVDAIKKLIFRARRRGVYVPQRLPGPPMVGKKQHVTQDWRDRAEKEARLKTIPEDTRGLTALICGDPLPGRSALDRGAE